MPLFASEARRAGEVRAAEVMEGVVRNLATLLNTKKRPKIGIEGFSEVIVSEIIVSEIVVKPPYEP